MAPSPIIPWQIGERGKHWQILFPWAAKSLQKVTVAMKIKDVFSLQESYDKPRQYIKKQKHHFADKGPCSQNYGSSSNHVWMWELEHKEGWVLKNGYFQTVVLEKTLESPLGCKESKPINPKGNQPWYSLEGLMLKPKLQCFGLLMQRADSLERP